MFRKMVTMIGKRVRTTCDFTNNIKIYSKSFGGNITHNWSFVNRSKIGLISVKEIDDKYSISIYTDSCTNGYPILSFNFNGNKQELIKFVNKEFLLDDIAISTNYPV